MSNRINVYLDNDYKGMLDELVKMTGKNQSELIRTAINEYRLSDAYKHDVKLNEVRTMKLGIDEIVKRVYPD